MIGFAVFGIMIYYFSIYYRPVRLLDSILARIAGVDAFDWKAFPKALIVSD